VTNTIEISRKLQQAAGIEAKLADAIVESQAEMVSGEAATKADLHEVRQELTADIAQLRTENRGEFTLLKWMLGVLIAGVVSLLFKAFS